MNHICEKIRSGTWKRESFYLHLWVCLIRIEARKYLCTVSVFGKTLEQLNVLTSSSHITYICAFQIMDRTSWRGWETEICWSELSSSLWIGPAVWLEATFTLSGQPKSWPKPIRHIIVPFASRCHSYWSVRCNNWGSTARHRSQWTSSPITPLVWLMDWKFTHLLRKQQKSIQTIAKFRLSQILAVELNFLHASFHGYTLRALFVNAVYVVWNGVGSDLYMPYGRIKALNIVQVWKWKWCNYVGGMSMPCIHNFLVFVCMWFFCTFH
jgi:hypothetical protein